MSNHLSVCVLGLGYVGLPTAAIIANRGIPVTGVDTRQTVVDTIANGETPIVEPGLDVLVKSAITSGYLKTELKPVPADVFILAVPTPFKDANVPDLSYLESAIASVAPVLSPGNLVILESTSPVGTTEKSQHGLPAIVLISRRKIHRTSPKYTSPTVLNGFYRVAC